MGRYSGFMTLFRVRFLSRMGAFEFVFICV